jgi:hypothetical protein
MFFDVFRIKYIAIAAPRAFQSVQKNIFLCCISLRYLAWKSAKLRPWEVQTQHNTPLCALVPLMEANAPEFRFIMKLSRTPSDLPFHLDLVYSTEIPKNGQNMKFVRGKNNELFFSRLAL